MGKLTTYIAILSTVIIGFHFAGLIGDTPISWLMDLLLNPEEVSSHAWYTTAFGVFALFSGVAIIVIGTLVPDRLEKAATIGLASLIGILIFDLVSIFNVLALSSLPLAIFVMSPLIVIFVLTVVEWWRGLTT